MVEIVAITHDGRGSCICLDEMAPFELLLTSTETERKQSRTLELSIFPSAHFSGFLYVCMRPMGCGDHGQGRMIEEQ